MGKESHEGWPVIDQDFEVNNAEVTKNGFEPEPDNGQYIVNKQEIPAVPERVNIEPDPNVINRLGDSGFAPEVTETDRVFSGRLHETGVRSNPERTGFDHEPAAMLNNIPKSFMDNAPERETPAERNFFDKFKGWLAGK